MTSPPDMCWHVWYEYLSLQRLKVSIPSPRREVGSTYVQYLLDVTGGPTIVRLGFTLL